MADTCHCLLLPGTLCDARLFAPLEAAWAAMGVHITTRVGDLHRLSDPAPSWWEAQLAGLPMQFDVLGFSLGGVLALQLLQRAPERVRRLVLVASNPMPGSAQHRERVLAQQTLWQEKGPLTVADALLDQASPRADAAVRSVVRSMAIDTPQDAFKAQGELNATRPDGIPVLANWHGPLMLLSGVNDPWCGADKQLLMQKAHPRTIWHELPDCGHYLPLEQPAALAHCTVNHLIDASMHS